MCKMIRQSREMWTILAVVLVSMSILTDASPVPTPEPETTTLLTTETVTETTSSPIFLHFEGNAHLASVYTLTPTETTTFPESDLYATTEYTTRGDKIINGPVESQNPSLSSEVPQVNTIRVEQVPHIENNKTEIVNISSLPANADQSESLDKEVRTTTVSWFSTTIAEMTTVSDGNLSMDLSTNLRENNFTTNAEVLPTVTYVAAEQKSESIEELKSIGTSEMKKGDIATDVPILKVNGEYTTTEVPTTIVHTEKAPHLVTVDYELPKSTEEILNISEEVASPTTPTKEDKTVEISTNMTEEVATSREGNASPTKEISHSTEETLKTIKVVSNITEEDGKQSVEVTKRTEEAAKNTGVTISKLTDEAEKSLEENILPTEEVSKVTEEVKKIRKETAKPVKEVVSITDGTAKPIKETTLFTKEIAKITEEVGKLTEEVAKLAEEVAKPTEEIETRTEDAKPTEEVRMDEGVSSTHVSTTAEILISSVHAPSETHHNSLDNTRDSRHFIEEANKPVAANETDSLPEMTTPGSIPTELTTIISVTQSSVIGGTNEQLEPNTTVSLQNGDLAAGDLNSTESSPGNQSITPSTPTEENVVNGTLRNVTEAPTAIVFSQSSDISQSPTTNELSNNPVDGSKNVLDTSVTKESKSNQKSTHSIVEPSAAPPSQSSSPKVAISEPLAEDRATWLFPDTTRVSSPSSASLESGARTVEKITNGTNRSIECSPEPVVSVFQGDLRYFIVLGLTACSVAATILLVTLVLIRLRGGKRRDTSPSLQLCGCLGRTQRAEITPRRAEVSEVKLRPGCNLATDADCRAGEGEEVPLATSARTGAHKQVPAPPAPGTMTTSTVKPNGAPPPLAKPGDSPVEHLSEEENEESPSQQTVPLRSGPTLANQIIAAGVGWETSLDRIAFS